MTNPILIATEIERKAYMQGDLLTAELASICQEQDERITDLEQQLADRDVTISDLNSQLSIALEAQV